MPFQGGGSWLTNQVFWSAITFLGNFVAFILVRESQFFIDQFGSEEQKWQLSTLLVSAEFIAPALLFCNFVWGSQIRKKCRNNLFLNVVMTYFAFLILAIAAHLGEYPKFHIEAEEKKYNHRKIHSLYTASAFALSSLGLSRAMKLQFEIGVFSFCVAYAMEVSLSILKENGRGRNWFYIMGTAIFCFLLILIRKYLDSLHEKHATKSHAHGPDQMGNQSPNVSIVNDSMNIEMVEAGLQRRHTQAKDGSSMNGDSDSHTGEPSHRWASSINDEREEREELWSVDEEHWESIPQRDDKETNSNGSDGDSEDTPLPPCPQIVNIGNPLERNQDQCCQAEQNSSSAEDFEGNQPSMPVVNIDSISEVVSIDQGSSFVGDSDSNPPPHTLETSTLTPSFQETDIDASSVKQGEESSSREKDPESSSAEDFEYTPRSLVNIGAAGSVDRSNADQNEHTRHRGKDVRKKFGDARSSLKQTAEVKDSVLSFNKPAIEPSPEKCTNDYSSPDPSPGKSANYDFSADTDDSMEATWMAFMERRWKSWTRHQKKSDTRGARITKAEPLAREELKKSDTPPEICTNDYSSSDPSPGKSANYDFSADTDDSLEATWMAIMEGGGKSLTPHLKKSDTWGGTITKAEPLAQKERKSDTFNAATSLKREKSMSQDELNRRAEAFIQKFNREVKLQRLQSVQRFMEADNRGV